MTGDARQDSGAGGGRNDAEEGGSSPTTPLPRHHYGGLARRACRQILLLDGATLKHHSVFPPPAQRVGRHPFSCWSKGLKGECRQVAIRELEQGVTRGARGGSGDHITSTS